MISVETSNNNNDNKGGRREETEGPTLPAATQLPMISIFGEFY